jgi:hypothetical protein
MRRRTCAVLVVAVLLTGCGPQPPLEVAVRKVSVDILLGARKKVQEVIKIVLPPPPVTGGRPVAVPTPQPSSPTAPAAPAPTPLPCPSADPLSFPAEPATAELTGSLVPGRYHFRNQGAYQPDTSAKTVYAFPPDTLHEVGKPIPQPVPGTYTYTLTDYNGGVDGKARVTTSFLVVPNNPTSGAPGGVTASQAAGIYITQLTTDYGNGRATVFTPNPPIVYFELPVTFGLAWDTAGSDGQTTMKLHASIDDSSRSRGGHRVVDACGTPLDSWEVNATGTLVGPSQNLQLSWVYDVATQLGGLTLRTVSISSGTQSPALGATLLSSNTATISRQDPQ